MTEEFQAEFNLSNNAAEDEECGYAEQAALYEVTTLDTESVRRLAAMAVTFYDSPWSDHAHATLRCGIASVLRRPREPYD